MKYWLNLTILMIFCLVISGHTGAQTTALDNIKQSQQMRFEKLQPVIDQGNKQNPVVKENPGNPGIDATAAPVRDPFNPPVNDNGDFRNQSRNRRSSTSFLPNNRSSSIPAITLRGVVHPDSNGDGLLALLEIGDHGVYMVREGDEISYDQSRPSAAIKIMRISRLSVIVEAGSLGNTLIIR